MHKAYLSLGSNMGDRGEYLQVGVSSLTRGDDFRLSGVYETEPVGGVAQDNFWNVVLELTTNASARDLLQRARDAEATALRTRDVRWGPRTLDVDVLVVGNEVLNELDLVVPHPRMRERAFVLAPLRELAPALVSDDALDRAEGRVQRLGTLESLR